MTAKPCPGTLNESAVFKVVSELRGEVSKLRKEVAKLSAAHERLERGQQCLIGQNREMMEAHAAERSAWIRERVAFLTRIDALIGANNTHAIENAALYKAVALKTIKAMTMPVQVDSLTMARLVQSMRDKAGPYEDSDLQRSQRECDRPMHRNSGN